MGVDILLKHRMTTIHREQPFSGRVIGITAIEVDDWFKPTGKSINIRARKGIIVASGGCADNVEFRTMFDVRLTEEYQAENSGWSKRTADGEIAAMQIGAALGATACQTTRRRQHAQQGPDGREVERRRDRDLSGRARTCSARARSGWRCATIRTSSW